MQIIRILSIPIAFIMFIIGFVTGKWLLFGTIDISSSKDIYINLDNFMREEKKVKQEISEVKREILKQ